MSNVSVHFKLLLAGFMLTAVFLIAMNPQVYAHSHYMTNEKNGKCHSLANSDENGGPHNDNPSGDVLHKSVHTGKAGKAFDNENNPVDVHKGTCPE